MSFQVIRHARLEIDIFEIADFIANHQLESGIRFISAMEQRIGDLAEWPHRGLLFETDDPALQGIRHINVKGFSNFLVYYRVVKDEVHIYRVLHGARDVQGILTQSREDPPI